jgi:hypothetical protein
VIWLLALTALGTLALVIGLIATDHAREWHHGFLGLPLALLAIGGVLPLWVGWIGCFVLLDDAAQHLVQIWRSEHRSLLHLAYRHLLYNPINRLRR